MQELTQTTSPTPNTSEEVLISREITFRNSTFGALKTFIRAHKRRTGETLSNAAAVDMILRAYLATHIHQDAVKTMCRMARPQTLATLKALPSEPVEESQAVPVATPTPRPHIIKVTMPARRRVPLVATPGDAMGSPS